jgi:ligand-binding sensor domain-containing protein
MFFDEVTNTVWIAYATKGISQVNAGTQQWTSYTLVQGLPSNTVMAITRAKNNTDATLVIWAATQNGLAKLINNRWESYAVAGGLPSSRTRSLYSDDGVRLWVGFVDAGAVKIK